MGYFLTLPWLMLTSSPTHPACSSATPALGTRGVVWHQSRWKTPRVKRRQPHCCVNHAEQWHQQDVHEILPSSISLNDTCSSSHTTSDEFSFLNISVKTNKKRGRGNLTTSTQRSSCCGPPNCSYHQGQIQKILIPTPEPSINTFELTALPFLSYFLLIIPHFPFFHLFSAFPLQLSPFSNLQTPKSLKFPIFFLPSTGMHHLLGCSMMMSSPCFSCSNSLFQILPIPQFISSCFQIINLNLTKIISIYLAYQNVVFSLNK